MCFWYADKRAASINYVADPFFSSPSYLKDLLNNVVTLTPHKDWLQSAVDIAFRPLSEVIAQVVKDKYACQLQ